MAPPELISPPQSDTESARVVRHWALVVWPAFLAACLLEGLVFSMVDPSELQWMDHPVLASREGVYTAAFFCFWLIAMFCSGLALWLAKPAQDINDSRGG